MTVLEPSTPHAAAAMLAEAGRAGTSLRPRGSGSKQSWVDCPAGHERYLSTLQLSGPIHHYAGDLVATIPAGTTLATANVVLGRERQWLPLDPPFGDAATIGGIVATNDSGPRRHLHGAARDLIVGIEFALADGRIAKAGGRVVKNVAGYDLARLLCGSFGSLALITSATFKLAPVAPFSVTLSAEPQDAARACALALAVAAAPLVPSAIEVEAPSPRLLVRFETTEAAARQQAESARRLFDQAGAPARVHLDEDERTLWRLHERRVQEGGDVLFKISVLPTDLAGVFAQLDQTPASVTWRAAGRAALGLLLVRLAGAPEVLSDLVLRLRAHVASRGGHLVVLQSPPPVRARVDPWGELGHVSLMRAVKARFDPHNVLSPGCGPGGI
jgi:glycolate oxidase FAD binding subunit